MLTVRPDDQRSLAALARHVGSMREEAMTAFFASVCASGLCDLVGHDGSRLSDMAPGADEADRAEAIGRVFDEDMASFYSAYRWWLGYLVAGNFYHGHGGYDGAEVRQLAEVAERSLGLRVRVAGEEGFVPCAAEDRAEAKAVLPSMPALAEALATLCPEPRRAWG